MEKKYKNDLNILLAIKGSCIIKSSSQFWILVQIDGFKNSTKPFSTLPPQVAR